MRIFIITAILLNSFLLAGQVWISDLGNGRYKNPIIFADYSDPDVIRVGGDFYMVASSFNCMPGIPVLHSKDLVNWTIIGHVYDSLFLQKYDLPQHGEGSWAPSLRYHAGKFWVYVCTPSDGLFMFNAENITGPWKGHLVISVPMWEDPCPLWDDDGNAYLVRSKVCAGPLILHRMSPDGTRLLDNGKVIVEDSKNLPTLEGPKFYKINGWYYILAPAGGVSTGWQVALRSRNIYGPYEYKTVLHQGITDTNGPHQGGLVIFDNNESWFVHFQDRGPYGRIVHLQPVNWKDGWPEMGSDIDNDGIGEPVSEWKKPGIGKNLPVAVPQTSDEFSHTKPGLQWQWHANPKPAWYSLSDEPGYLRLYSQRVVIEQANLWYAPNLLLQKFMAPSFTVTTSVKFMGKAENERAGLVVMGEQYAFVAIHSEKGKNRISLFKGQFIRCGHIPQEIDGFELSGNTAFIKVQVREGAECFFSYSEDGSNYTPFSASFKAVKGRWIGAKVGLFAVHPNISGEAGYADFDWFRLE